MKISLRDITASDLDIYFLMKHPDRKHYDFNGPYFGRPTVKKIQVMVDTIRDKIDAGKSPIFSNKRLIVDGQDQMLGEVNYYWKSVETHWIMIKLSQKLGFAEEARYRKARIVDGRYFDSLSYGILKEDWERMKWQN